MESTSQDSHKLGAFLNHLPVDFYEHHAEESHYIHNKDAKNIEGCFSYQWKRELFAVYSIFMMDSQADRIRREATMTESGECIKETSAQRKRKKKSRHETVLSETEKKITDIISNVLPSLIEQAKELQCLDEPHQHSSLVYNNSIARAASQIIGCGNLFQVMCCDFDDENRKDSHDSSDVIIPNGENVPSYRASFIINRRVRNIENLTKIIEVDSHTFIIPPLSSFLTSSFHNFVSRGFEQIQVKDGHDLIVIDPPWNNKSVKRKKSYHMVQETDLKQIPISDLASIDSLVCVWITNNERLKSYVKDELFPHWAVDFVAEWFWMKVTKSGEPVCDLQSSHKKPYEQLIIGRFKKSLLKLPEHEPYDVGSISSPSVASKKCVDRETADSLCETSLDCMSSNSRVSDQKVLCLPQDFVLVSVPCSLHSKKPSLADILSQYLPSRPTCLELFARNLTPGWTSWGNEPLLHQHMDYFEKIQQTTRGRNVQRDMHYSEITGI